MTNTTSHKTYTPTQTHTDRLNRSRKIGFIILSRMWLSKEKFVEIQQSSEKILWHITIKMFAHRSYITTVTYFCGITLYSTLYVMYVRALFSYKYIVIPQVKLKNGAI